MMKISKMDSFLSQISLIVEKYDKEAKLSGENFNVFKILGLSTNEVRTHSAFIAELLNPKGTHGQGEVFLDLFIVEINKELNSSKAENDKRLQKKISAFKTDSAKVIIEHFIGLTDEYYTEGGRIDILLTDGFKKIIIENKIYAKDGINQLLRYYNYDSSAPLIYLTLFGNKPESNNNTEVDQNLLCISYEKTIIAWLENCSNVAEDHAILRETIKQYVFLIKYLTNQSNSSKMNTEIAKIIIEHENNINSFFLLNQRNLLEEVQRGLFKKLNEQLHTIMGFEIIKDSAINFNSKYVIFDLSKTKDDYVAYFGFTENNEFVYGLDRKCTNKRKEHFDCLTRELGVSRSGDSWAWWQLFEADYLCGWEQPEAWLAIKSGALMADVKKKLEMFVIVLGKI